MDNRNYNGIRKPAFMLSLTFIVMSVLYSCTSVEYGYVDNGTGTGTLGQTQVLFSFVGPDSQDNLPQNYHILMSRIVNEVHYTYYVDNNGEQSGEGDKPSDDNTSDVDSDAGQETGQDEVQEPGAGEEGVESGRMPVTVLDGDYYAIAFGNNGYSITELDEFRDNNAFGMKNLYAALPAMTEEEIEEQFGESFADLNPSYTSVSCAYPLYLSIRKTTLNSGMKPAEVVFSPSDITTMLIFRLKINVDDGVEITRLVAELSGVPVKVQLMSGIVDDSSLGKTYFSMYQIDRTDNVLTFEGGVRALGLFSSRSSSLVSGPGILRLSVHASCDTESGPRERRFYVGINMKSVIDEAQIMLRTDDGLGYRTIIKEAVLEIGKQLVIRKGNVVSGGDDAVEDWFVSKDNDVNTEV